MTIQAKIIADSISPEGIRLTTMQLRYPRFIHAEFMTHRTFSRNASSSRAIPVERMIEDLMRDPAMPVYWGANQKGMQAGEELSGPDLYDAKDYWLSAMNDSIKWAYAMIDAHLHKQIANRILEPWAHINVVVTATEWNNFFNLRAHKDAQPEIHALAFEMLNAMAGSQPRVLTSGEWHLPYVHEPYTEQGIEAAKRVSVARCARVSYLTHDGRETTVEEDLALYERLVGSEPLHASPAEHQATPDYKVGPDDIEPRPRWNQGYLHGNFNGWVQNRKMLELGVK